MSAKFTPQDIAMYTGVSQRKIEYVLSHFRDTGTIRISANEKPSLSRSLTPEDVQVCATNIYSLSSLDLALSQHLLNRVLDSPDIYLDELRQDLELTRGKSVSISTIYRTLTKAGLTRKKVRSHHAL